MRSRPTWVWVIFIFYVVSSAWGLLSRALIHRGVFPVPAAQQAALRSQPRAGVVVGLTIMTLNLLAALWLWLLRKRAFDLFVGAFVLSLASVAWQLVVGGPLRSLSAQGPLVLAVALFGLFVGWGISAAVCLYAWSLRKSGVLQ